MKELNLKGKEISGRKVPIREALGSVAADKRDLFEKV